MANAIDITLHELGAEASAGSGAAVDLGELRSAVRLSLAVTAIVAQCLVTVETSPNGTTGWRSVGFFQAAKGAEAQQLSFDRCDRYVRVSWSAGATFSVAGEAHVLFAKRENVTGLALLPAGVEECTTHQWAEALIVASCDAEDAISTANPMPLTKWPPSLSYRVAAIAGWLLIAARGADGGEGTADAVVMKAHDDAQGWLKRIARGELKPPGLVPGDNLGIRTRDAAGVPVTEDTPCAPARFFGRFGDFG